MQSDPSDTSGTSGTSDNGIEILIAEDSPTQAMKLQHTLEQHAYRVTVTRHGQEALDALRQRRARLVISDIEMPVMNGYELCQHIKADEELRDIPVILLTSLSDPKDVVKGLECGADNFLVKPFDEEFLLSRIHYMLESREPCQSANGDAMGGIEVFLAGEKHCLSTEPSVQTTVGLLLGTYETTLQKNRELSEAKTAIEQQAAELARSNTELQQLSRELRDKNAHMQADLDLAREIQSAFIPRQYPSFPHVVPPMESALRFCHRWIPTTTLGGDFFDVLALSETQAGVFICDVMGHGVRSALVTAMMRALVGERTSVAANPGEFLQELNRHLIGILQQTRTPLFASAFYFVADVETGEISYANAGHPSPLWVRREAGVVEPLPLAEAASGPALGVFEDATYDTSQCTLAVEDFLVLFTDGLVEVEGPTGEYGEERLMEAVRAHLHLEPALLFEALMADIRGFSGSEDFEDDVCLVGMEVTRLGPVGR